MPETTNKDGRLLSPDQVAEWLGVSTGTLAVWRATNRYDLEYIKIGRNVRYPEVAVNRFIDSRRVRGCSEEA